MSPSSNLAGVFHDALTEHVNIIRRLAGQQDAFTSAAALLSSCVLRGNKILWCGNGGSAADAQHFAAELVGRFRRPRGALASIALTTDTSVLTAVTNDFSFEQVFARQVDALCQPGDVVVALSTSGNSGNVCAALHRARELEAFTIAMTGESGGRLVQYADVCLSVPSKDPARIQEAHTVLGHMLCDCLDRAMSMEEEFEAAGAVL